ncbi:MAG: hypothetical protein GSR84_01510 [Desulfurococcales archaeon]|nr:hypothetical protein [Desulfurococcales archaeon]
MVREGFIEDITARGPPVVVYHWDADGMISAMHIVMAAGEDTVLHPPKFTFKVTREFIESLKKSLTRSRTILILDLAYPGKILDMIAKETGARVIVVDHHYQEEEPRSPNVEYINPASKGDQEGRWPSAAHVLARLLGKYHPALVAASIVGDLGPAAKANREYQNYMVEAGLDPVNDYWIIQEAVEQLNSIDRMGNYHGLRWIPKVHAIGQFDPLKSVLNDPLLTTLRTQADVEWEELVARAEEELREEAPGILGVVLEGEGRHVSKLARHLASKHRGKIIVVAYYASSTGEARVYARAYGYDKPLTPLIRYFKKLGYEAGGKYQRNNNVVGVECAREEMEKVYKLMIEKLKEMAG